MQRKRHGSYGPVSYVQAWILRELRTQFRAAAHRQGLSLNDALTDAIGKWVAWANQLPPKQRQKECLTTSTLSDTLAAGEAEIAGEGDWHEEAQRGDPRRGTSPAEGPGSGAE
jgi:hypothetical protein